MTKKQRVNGRLHLLEQRISEDWSNLKSNFIHADSEKKETNGSLFKNVASLAIDSVAKRMILNVLGNIIKP